jgi:hypothetical protein
VDGRLQFFQAVLKRELGKVLLSTVPFNMYFSSHLHTLYHHKSNGTSHRKEKISTTKEIVCFLIERIKTKA